MCAVVRIAPFDIQWGHASDVVHFSNPTAFAALALGGICKQCLDSRPAINSFVEWGVVPALVRLLSKSTCPVTFRVTGHAIQWLCSGTSDILASQSERSTWPQNLKLAEEFYEAGERKPPALLLGALKQVRGVPEPIVPHTD